MRRATHDLLVVGQINQISIHALREESDATTGSIAGWKMDFQSTLSVRRATIVNNITIIYILFQSTLSVRRATFMWVVIFPLAFTISIHALREESDDTYLLVTNECMNFNPRSPWGERLFVSTSVLKFLYFNPRSPWGERLPFRRCISHHSSDFNPRSPWGERRIYCTWCNYS